MSLKLIEVKDGVFLNPYEIEAVKFSITNTTTEDTYKMSVHFKSGKLFEVFVTPEEKEYFHNQVLQCC